MNGKVIGSGLPRDYIDCHAWGIYQLFIMLLATSKKSLEQRCYGSSLSQRLVERSSVQKYLYGFVWHAIIKWDFFNRVIYIADYQLNGISSSITRLRMNSPIGSMLTYTELVHYPIPFKDKLRNAINYWRFSFFV